MASKHFKLNTSFFLHHLRRFLLLKATSDYLNQLVTKSFILWPFSLRPLRLVIPLFNKIHWIICLFCLKIHVSMQMIIKFRLKKASRKLLSYGISGYVSILLFRSQYQYSLSNCVLLFNNDIINCKYISDKVKKILLFVGLDIFRQYRCLVPTRSILNFKVF